MDDNHIIVFCTVPDSECARLISRELVEGKLAACSNIVPGIQSIYTWENELQDDHELLLVIKTRTDLFDELQKKIVQHHPYTVPEIIALPIIKGNSEYLKWIDENVKKR